MVVPLSKKTKRNVHLYFFYGFALFLVRLVWLMMAYSMSEFQQLSSLSSAATLHQRRFHKQHHWRNDDDDNTGVDHNKLHIVISTDCSYFMDWLSYTFFYHAMEVKQPGHVTRIASGCNETQQQTLTQHFQEDIAIMSNNRFHLHFTPQASGVSKYFNKPIGLHHWMEHVLGFPHDTNSSAHDDTIIVIMDPDMILLKPFVNNFTFMSEESNWNEGASKRPIRTFVKPGFPMAQHYGYRDFWKRITVENMTSIVGKESPVHNVSEYDATWYFPAGPPFVLAAPDLYQMAPLWLNFSMAFHRFSPQPMSEMYGYSIAAAHLKLPHQLALGFMVGFPPNDVEGWAPVDTIPASQVCSNSNQPDQLPPTIHYCQQFGIGEHYFFKYFFYDNFLSCEGPLLLEPPNDAALQYNFSHLFLENKIVVWTEAKLILRHAFLTCRVISGLNRAATFFKRNKCGDDANYEQSWSFFEEYGPAAR